MNATFSSDSKPAVTSRDLWRNHEPPKLPIGILIPFDCAPDDTKVTLFRQAGARSVAAKARNRESELGASDETVVLLSKWEGYVSDIDNECFTAIMGENLDSDEIVATFSKTELSEGDLSILTVGIPLIWTITKERRRGSVKRCSSLRIRRIPLPMRV